MGYKHRQAGLLLLVSLFLVPLAGVLPAFGVTQFVPVGDSVYTRQDLLDRFFSERGLLVVYGASSPDMKARMQRAMEGLRWRGMNDVRVQHVKDVRPEDMKGTSLLLVGTPDTNPYLKQLPTTFPLQFRKDGFTFLGKSYKNTDTISLMRPSVFNASYPMFILAGGEEEILGFLDFRQLMQNDYQIVRKGQRLRLGHFSQDAASLWQLDPELDLDYEESVRLVGTTENFRFYAQGAAMDHQRIAGIIRRHEANYRRIRDFATLPPAANRQAGQKHAYYLYPSLQDKAVITNSMDFAHVDYEADAVHVALEDGIDGDALNKDAVLMVRTQLGKTDITALEDGLSVYLSETWFGRPYQEWANRIAHSNLQMTIEDLLDNERYAESSPLMREVLAGAMVSCMINRWGKENFMAHYNWWTPAPDEWGNLNFMWEKCMEAGKANYQPVPQRPRPASFQKGFNFAHEGYGITNGYGSRSARLSMDRLKEMGSTAVSMIPYSFMRDPFQPTHFRLPNTSGDENDGAVAHAARYAQSIGFTTMIKPQIWVRGSWPGDVDMQTPEHWETFFAHYEHWITHYALLGEIFNVDILCIGTELTKATLFDQDRWASFAGNLRSIYSGQLVYAPNWGEEFENLTFWDAFDYIGLNSYYPLSELDAPSDKELMAGARAVVKRMEKTHKRFDKPILLTEIGFANTSAPWKLPYQEYRREPANPEDQARCYKIMVEALKDAEWLQGIYWWKWPSYLDRGGMDQTGFTPNGKLAENVVTNWYSSF